MTEKLKMTQQLVDVITEIEELQETERRLRSELLRLMEDNESIQVNSHIVTKKVIRETITDAQLLQQLGFDLNRVTVTVTKIDPKLVKVIGEAEKKSYYTEKPTIVVTKSK